MVVQLQKYMHTTLPSNVLNSDTDIKNSESGHRKQNGKFNLGKNKQTKKQTTNW